jgi:methylmalonic aciduria homocystinuria type C protein
VSEWSQITARIADGCGAAGLDLIQPFQVAWYNAAVDPAYRLADLGRPQALGVLIGNTRALWPHFQAALRVDPALCGAADPIESYVSARVLAALRPLVVRWEVRWAHDPPPRRVAMQRLAHVSGLAYLAPSFLNVHPVYGPWIALRAAVVVDTAGPSGPPPALASPCRECAHACGLAFERAIAARRNRDATAAGLGDTWRRWLAVRDACPIGREHRYSEAQIAYHYCGDRTVLQRT